MISKDENRRFQTKINENSKSLIRFSLKSQNSDEKFDISLKMDIKKHIKLNFSYKIDLKINIVQ